MSPSNRKYRPCEICGADLSHGEVYACRACQSIGWHKAMENVWLNAKSYKPEEEDPLDPARGIIFALIAGAAIWAIVALIIWRFICG